jgi:hypothetical protein
LQIDSPQFLSRVKTFPPIPKVGSRAPAAARAELEESSPARHTRVIVTTRRLRIDQVSFDTTLERRAAYFFLTNTAKVTAQQPAFKK